jgi:diacylglycerol O-acyltransferase
MYRLHGQDAAWLYRETLTTPMHTLKIFLVSLAPGQQLDFDAVRQSVPRLLHEVPMLRQRPVFVPFGLHHPVMIEDPEFNLDYHLNRAAVPAPGGMPELEDVISHIASHPLDQTRPLWQFWVVEGLQDGRIALVQKIHHTLADGMASVNFIMRVWQSGYHDPGSVAPPWTPEAVPGRGRLVVDALKDHFSRDIRKLPDFLAAFWHSTWDIMRRARGTESPTLKSMFGDLPQMRWNRALSSRRSFATAQLELERMKALRVRLGGTLNDLVLAVAAGSVRAYLQSHNELPDTPLLVTVPVARELQASHRESGNSTAVVCSLLHVEIADPIVRFNATRESTELGKSELDIVGRDTFGLMAHYIPPAVQQHTANRAYRTQSANAPGYRPPSNLSVSNVPGPRSRFEAQGNVVEDLYSAGPLVEGMGLNITVWSYAGNMNFTLVGCMKALPDIRAIAEGLEISLAELEQCCESPHELDNVDSSTGPGGAQ